MQRRFLRAVLALTVLCAPILARAANQVPTTNYAGVLQPLKAGDTLTLRASTTSSASINLPPGSTPTTPNDGDCWTTTSGFYCRINGVTVGPMGTGGSGTPGGTSGQVQYNNAGAFGGFTLSGDATLDTSTGALTLSTVNAGPGSCGDATHVCQITTNGKGLTTAQSAVSITVPTGANPTASLGLTAVNGSASTFMRSDAAPALDQSIAPTWMGLHTFSAGLRITPEATPATNEGGYLGAPLNEQDSSYTLAMTDAGNTVRANSASALSYTIPPNSSVAFPVGTVIALRNAGAGKLTITQGAGVTLSTAGTTTTGNVTVSQGALVTILKEATDSWVILGASGTGSTGGIVLGAAFAPQGRLTLSSGKPVMTSDVTGAGTLYYDCYAGAGVPGYNGSSIVIGSIGSCEVSDAMAASGTGVLNASNVFDIFWSPANSNICVATNGSGAGWSGDTGGSTTVRGTGYSQLENTLGFWTNKNTVSHCYNGSTDYGSVAADQLTYLGSLYTTAAGKTGMVMNPASANGGANNVLGVWNAYNRVTITAANYDDAGCNGCSWTYNSTTWRAKNGSTNNRITWVDGLAQSLVIADFAQYLCDGASSNFNVGLGIDWVSGAPIMDSQSYNNICVMQTGHQNVTGLYGVHYLQAVEARTEGSAAATVFGERDGAQSSRIGVTIQQ